jgi:hypothetical protein
MKECPKCHSKWPDEGKFCPMDGSTLVIVKAEEPKPSSKAEKARAEGGHGKKTSRQFSETKWFMAGESLKDEELTPEDIPIEDLDAIYRKTGEIPPELRKKFSLTYKDKKEK